MKSFGLSFTLLSIVLLMSAGSAFARESFMAIPAGSAAHLRAAVSPADTARIVTAAVSSIFMDSDDHARAERGQDMEPDSDRNHNGDRDHDRDRDRDRDRDDHAPSPAPEPSTFLSFGVALLVGAGVLLSRRLLGSRK